MKEIWAVFNGDLFDRIILRGWWIYRQECFFNTDTGTVTWRDVPFFRRRKTTLQPSATTRGDG